MHGALGQDHHTLRPALDPLGDILELIYYDHRGNGASGRPPRETRTRAQFADDAAALATHLGHERVAVLGFSYGGTIALEFALRHPDRLRHLLVMGATSQPVPGDEVLAGAGRMGASEGQLAILQSDEHPATVDAFRKQQTEMLPLFFHENRPEYARLLDDVVFSIEGWSSDTRPAAYTSRLGEVKAPALILAGRSDFVCPPEQAEILQRGIPDAELRVFEECGHAVPLEQRQASLDAIHEWFGRHPGG